MNDRAFSTPQDLARQRAMTLIEVMVTIAIIAIVTAGVVIGSGAVGNARVKGAATMIAGAARVAFTRASATSRPMRLVLDIDQASIVLEESDDVVLVTKDDVAAGAAGATEAEQHAINEADRILKGPRAPRALFRPVKAFGFDAEGKGGRSLGAGVRIRRVETAHSMDGQTTGRAYVFFWPGGQTERAAIQIASSASEGAEDGLTVLISPLTGRTQIVGGARSLEPARDDGTFSEREDRLF